MVSECKICGEKTRGHRQYCPDCRRERKEDKKPERTCIICDRELRTGRKYCYLHRGMKKAGKKNSNDGIRKSNYQNNEIRRFPVFDENWTPVNEEKKIKISLVHKILMISVICSLWYIVYLIMSR